VVEHLAEVGVGEDQIVIGLVARPLEVPVQLACDPIRQRHGARAAASLRGAPVAADVVLANSDPRGLPVNVAPAEREQLSLTQPGHGCCLLDDRPEAIEIELTDKSARRLDELIRAWRRTVATRQFARVCYLCSPRAFPYVTRAVKRIRATSAIDVELLEQRDQRLALPADSPLLRRPEHSVVVVPPAAVLPSSSKPPARAMGSRAARWSE
jgi:hypothetical protein